MKITYTHKIMCTYYLQVFYICTLLAIGPAHIVLVCVAYAQNPPTKANVVVSSMASDKEFC